MTFTATTGTISRIDSWGKGQDPTPIGKRGVNIKGVPGDANGAGLQVDQQSIPSDVNSLGLKCTNSAIFSPEWYGPAGWQVTTSGADTERFEAPTNVSEKEVSTLLDVGGKAYYKIRVSPGVDLSCQIVDPATLNATTEKKQADQSQVEISRIDSWGKGPDPTPIGKRGVNIKGVPGGANGAGLQVDQQSIPSDVNSLGLKCTNSAIFSPEWYGPAGWQVTTSGADTERFEAPTNVSEKEVSTLLDVGGKAYYKIRVSPGVDLSCQITDPNQ